MEQIKIKAKDYDRSVVEYGIEFGYARRMANEVCVATVHPCGMHDWHNLRIYYKEGRGYYVNLPFPCGERKQVFFTPEWDYYE